MQVSADRWDLPGNPGCCYQIVSYLLNLKLMSRPDFGRLILLIEVGNRSSVSVRSTIFSRELRLNDTGEYYRDRSDNFDHIPSVGENSGCETFVENSLANLNTEGSLDGVSFVNQIMTLLIVRGMLCSGCHIKGYNMMHRQVNPTLL